MDIDSIAMIVLCGTIIVYTLVEAYVDLKDKLKEHTGRNNEEEDVEE